MCDAVNAEQRSHPKEYLGDRVATREPTIDEYLDSRIKGLQMQLEGLEDLKNNLPKSYLRSPMSRISRLWQQGPL